MLNCDMRKLVFQKGLITEVIKVEKNEIIELQPLGAGDEIVEIQPRTLHYGRGKDQPILVVKFDRVTRTDLEYGRYYETDTREFIPSSLSEILERAEDILSE